MHILSVPCVGLASIDFAVGMYYLLFYLKKPQIKEHLTFALLCLSAGFYAVFAAGLYSSNSLVQGIFWQRLQLDTVIAISVFLLWFTGVFTEQKDNRPILMLIGGFAIIFLAALFLSPEFSLSPANPAIKNINALGIQITYYEGSLGFVYQAETLLAIIAFIYILYLFIRYYWKTRYKTLLLIIGCLFLYFLGVGNDSLVAFQVYRFVYVSEYWFSFIIISMAYTLLDKFVNLQTTYEELNKDLEQKVRERTSEVERLNRSLKELAERDGLTGAYNRRFFNEYFEIEVKRAKNYLEHRSWLGAVEGSEMNFGMAFIDIDRFKPINDTYGHAVGDSVLKQVTDIIERLVFTRDVLCRYGSDEFVVLLTKTSRSGVLQAAEKIRKEIAGHEFEFDKTKTRQHVTVSIGLVNFADVLEENNEKILKLADDRLLRAKSGGRNRIVSSDEA